MPKDGLCEVRNDDDATRQQCQCAHFTDWAPFKEDEEEEEEKGMQSQAQSSPRVKGNHRLQAQLSGYLICKIGKKMLHSYYFP